MKYLKFMLYPCFMYGKTIEELKSCTDYFIERGSNSDITPTTDKMIDPSEEHKMVGDQRNNKIFAVDKIYLNVWRPIFNPKHYVEVKIGDLELSINSNAYQSFKRDVKDLRLGKRGMLYDIRCDNEVHSCLPEEFVNLLQSYDWKSLNEKFEAMEKDDEKAIQELCRKT